MGAWIEIKWILRCTCPYCVAPLVGAWIEIQSALSVLQKAWVAPLVGAWIEITVAITPFLTSSSSLPLWERGLKFWNRCSSTNWRRSLPLWERGLKLRVVLLSVLRIQVGDMLDECVERFPF